jgi:hypothetical protein
VTNVLSDYNPIWYAQKALTRLEKLLTFVPTIGRQYEKDPKERGSVISIKTPSTFTATTMPQGTTFQGVNAESQQMTLDQWWGVQFAIRDDQMAYTGEEIIRSHIDPAMQALAERIETWGTSLYAEVPWFAAIDGTTPTNDFINTRKILADNFVPQNGRYAAITTTRSAVYLGQSLFVSALNAGDGGAALMSGQLGQKFGFERIFENFSLPTHVPGALVGSPTVGTGAGVLRARTMVWSAGALTGTVARGDTFVIAGNTQRYAVTAAATAAGNAITVSFTPSLVQAYANGAAITVRQSALAVSLMYHKDAFSMAMAPLSDAGNNRGAEVGYAVDDQTGLAIRVMRWFDPGAKQHAMSFDALWGGRCVDPNRAVRLEG